MGNVGHTLVAVQYLFHIIGIQVAQTAFLLSFKALSIVIVCGRAKFKGIVLFLALGRCPIGCQLKPASTGQIKKKSVEGSDQRFRSVAAKIECFILWQ